MSRNSKVLAFGGLVLVVAVALVLGATDGARATLGLEAHPPSIYPVGGSDGPPNP